jgi:hypothetical protein
MEGVKTAMLRFKLNQVLGDSSSLRVQASPKKTLTKEGEYDYHTFGYNLLLSGGTVTTSLCTCVWFLWRTTLYSIAQFWSIGNNIIPPQLLQRTTMVMLVPNLNLSMLLSQHAETMIPMYEIVQIPLDSGEDLLFVQERLATYYSMLERSLRLSYGQLDIEWCQQPMAQQLSMIGSKPATPLYKALYKTLMNVKRKADCEQPLATIDVMNSIARVFGYGPLCGTTEISGHYLFLCEVECARLTTNLSRKERKEAAVQVARPECVYSAEESPYYERNQDWYIHRDYNRVVQPIVYADRVLIPDQAVTPPLEGTSTAVKATCDERRPEQEPRESREELRVIHDNHGIIDARANMDECINENYNPQCEVSAPGVTQTKDQVLRDKSDKTHESSNMAVAVRRTSFTDPRAQSAALHGKTRPDHVHARAMAEEVGGAR